MSRVPKYLKHSSGQARVVINGKAFYLGKHGSKISRQRYDALIAEWLVSNRSETFGMEAGEVQMQDLMLAYLKYAKSYYGTDQSSDYYRIRDALKIASKLYSTLEVGEFGPKQFKAIRQHMLDRHDWARTTINSRMRLILRMVKWGASEGMYPASIYETLRLIPGLKKGRSEARETEKVKPVSTELVESTIKHCSPVIADMIRVQQLTGCRPGEVCKLTPAMFDRSGKVWTVELEEHKTAHHNKVRIIYFGPKAQAIIKPYLLRGPDERLFTPRDSERRRREALERHTPDNCGNRPGYSFRTRRGLKPRRTAGDAYNTQSYGKAIKYACKKGKLDHWAPNQIRHAAGTELRKAFGLDGAQVILGHSSADITQVYAEQDQKRAMEIIAQVG